MPGIIDTLNTTRNRTTKLALLVCLASYIALATIHVLKDGSFDPLRYAAGLIGLLFVGGGVDALQTFAGRGK